MTAITWRSLMGQDPDPVRAMSDAQNSFEGMFGSLNTALTQYQQQQQAQETKLKSDNLERFYAEASSKYSTPEAFQAALASGELQGLADSYGDAIDKAAVRNFLDTRGGVLQQRQQDQWKYQDAVTNRAAEPFVDDIRSRIAAGDFSTARALLEENVLPNEAALYEAMRSAEDKDTERSRGNTRFEWETADRADTEARRSADSLFSQAYLNARGKMSENGLPNESAMTDEALKLIEGQDPRIAAKVLQSARQADVANVQAWREEQDKNGYVGSVPLNPTAVSSSLEDVIKDIPEGDQESVRAHVNELVRNGVTIPKGTKLPDGTSLEEDMKVPVPFNVARSAILESYGPWYKFGYRRGKSATDIIEEQVRRPEVFMDILMRDRAERLKATLRQDPNLSSGTAASKKKN